MRSTQNPNQSQDNTNVALLRSLLIISIIANWAALIASAAGSFEWQYLVAIRFLLIFATISLILLLRGTLLPAQILTSLSVVITHPLTQHGARIGTPKLSTSNPFTARAMTGHSLPEKV